MATRQSNCSLCGYLCGLLAHFDNDGTLVKVEPDPARYPYDAAIMRGCRRFASNVEVLTHPARINDPLKRIGARGSGQWQRVTWDEALDDIAARLIRLKDRYGPETLATCIAAPRSQYWPLHRFLNLFGSPNNIGVGNICWNSSVWVHSLTYGWPVEAELDPQSTACVVMWGINPAESDNSLLWHTLRQYCAAGGTLIVIDPRCTLTAARASRWLPVRPGTDGALALAMLRVIITEELYDHDFVANWCSGFARLRDRVAAYPPERAAEITGIPAGDIVAAARSFATLKPAALFSGLGIDQSGFHCTQTLRALAVLRAITGNLDEPGACHLSEMPDFIPESRLELSDTLAPEQRRKKLGREYFPLPTYEGYERLTQFTRRHGKTLPARYLTSAHPHLVWQAMVTGKPYPIRALTVLASNPLLSQPNTLLVHEALTSLDLLVVLELFPTPTTALADYVLPMAGTLEQPVLQTNAGVANIAYGGTAALPPLFARRHNFYFWRDLGRRCGQQPFWPWETLEEALDEIFAPAGLNWQEFCRTGLYAPPRHYRKYRTQGFATPSGKVELYSAILEEMGYDPLPTYVPRNDGAEPYPLRLVTGVRCQPYYASELRQIAALRRRRPQPVAEMAAVTAGALGLADGDNVWIESPQGRIQQVLRLREMVPDTVSVEYGWWYPEQPLAEPSLGGAWQSNANVLTSAAVASCDPILGQWSYRTLRCRVYKVEGE